MNIKKSQLLEIIKAVVRETIKERKDKWIQKAVDPSHKGYCTPMTKSTCTPRRKALAKRFKSGDIHQDNVDEQQMHEVAPPGFGPDKKHAKIYNKIKAQYPGNDAAAYATMWKIHNKISEVLKEAGLTSEANKVDPKDLETATNIARKIWGNPAETVEWGGSRGGYTYFDVVGGSKHQNIVAKNENGQWTYFDNGDWKVYGPTNETSYKVASPTQTRVQKDDQARTVQTEPKVTENHKVQHRSACTVKDLPNDPKNVRDPEVPNC